MKASSKATSSRIVRPRGDRGLSQESRDQVISRRVYACGETNDVEDSGTAQGSDEPCVNMEAPEVEASEEDGEEAEKPKTREMPRGPTKKERQDHETTHLPFRSWCRHCVRGRGRNNPHKKQADDPEEVKEMRVSRIHMDYFFMSQEEKTTGKNPLMLMIDE